MPKYDPVKVDLSEEEHLDAKEVNDLVNALVDGEGDKAKEAVEAVFALMDDITDPDSRFTHLFKVLQGVLSCQLQGRLFAEPPPA